MSPRSSTPADTFEVEDALAGVEHASLTERQQKAQALENEDEQRKQSEADARKLAAIVESSDDGIVSKDLNGIVTSWNHSAERMFGYKAEEIVGRSIRIIIPPELQDDEARILEKIRRGERIEHFETVRLTKDGRRIDVSLTISPVRDSSGRVFGAAKIMRDITERRRTEEALRRSDKLAATGQFAAVLAHEINNPMQALTNLLALISRSSLDENTRQLLSLGETELRRISRITRHMFSLYREPSPSVPVKVTDVLEDTLELFMSRIQANQIEVKRRYELGDEMCAYPAELQQLAASLLGNAIEAIREGGRAYIHALASRSRRKPETRGFRILIADNGPGIPASLRGRLFEPFFTTKAEKGTGLGLWVVKSIVAKHGGSVQVRSRIAPGRSGTAIAVFLPSHTPRQDWLAKASIRTDSAAGELVAKPMSGGQSESGKKPGSVAA